MILADVTIEVDAGALLILPLVLLIGWFASRVLGVRQTWFRTFVTGFFGWVLAVLVAGISAEPHATTAELLLRIVPYSILATMAFAIAFDFMARPGSKDPYERLGRLPQVPHPVRRVQRTMAPPLRFRQVLGIARREGLLHRRFASAAGIADPEFGPRLRSTLEQCGGMFIKLGQVASTRSDLLPAPVITELTQLVAGELHLEEQTFFFRRLLKGGTMRGEVRETVGRMTVAVREIGGDEDVARIADHVECAERTEDFGLLSVRGDAVDEIGAC